MSVWIAEAIQGGSQIVADPTSLTAPVDRRAQVGHGFEHVQRMGAGRGHRRLVDGRDRHQQRWIGHPATGEQSIEGGSPVATEVDVVVGGSVGQRTPRADVPDDRRR